MKIFALFLVLLGFVAFIVEGIRLERRENVFDATSTEEKNFPVAPLLGAISLIGGIALLVADKRHALIR